jgi:PleD family two-component response regulator
VRAQPVSAPNACIPVRMSAGVAVLPPEATADGPEALLALAARALTRAKSEGRDRACFVAADVARRQAV